VRIITYFIIFAIELYYEVIVNVMVELLTLQRVGIVAILTISQVFFLPLHTILNYIIKLKD